MKSIDLRFAYLTMYFFVVLGVLSACAFLYMVGNAEARQRANEEIFDYILRNTEKAYQVYYVYTLQDPDKDSDGLADAHEEVFGSKKRTSDSLEKGKLDGAVINSKYRQACAEQNMQERDRLSQLTRSLETPDEYSVQHAFETRGIESYNEYVGLPKKIKDTLYDGVVLFQDGKNDEAIQHFLKAQEVDGDEYLYTIYLAYAYIFKEEYEKALSLLEPLHGNKDIESILLFRGLITASIGAEDSNRVSQYAREAIEKFPKEPVIYNVFALYLHTEKNDSTQAVEVIRKGLEMEPRFSGFYNTLAIIASDQYDRETEIKMYEKAIEIDPLFTSAHTNLSLLYYQYLFDIKNAYIENCVALTIFPKDRYRVEQLKLAYQMGYTEEAEVLETYFTEKEIDDPKILNMLGLFYMEKREWSQANALFLKTVSLDPKFKQAYNNLGNSYASLGDFEHAKKSYEKAIELDPEYARPYYNLAVDYLDIRNDEGRILIGENVWTAIDLLNTAYELDPEWYSLPQALGKAYYYLGTSDKTYLTQAEEYLLRADALRPNDWLTCSLLRDTYALQGNRERENHYQKIVDSLDSKITDPNMIYVDREKAIPAQ